MRRIWQDWLGHIEYRIRNDDVLRKIISSLSPKLMSRIEAESRRWFMQCRHCGYEISVWDYGGIRYRALGTVYRFGRCRNCGKSGKSGKSGMLRVYLRDASSNTPVGPE